MLLFALFDAVVMEAQIARKNLQVGRRYVHTVCNMVLEFYLRTRKDGVSILSTSFDAFVLSAVHVYVYARR